MAIQLLNSIGIGTRWGYRTFELYSGDITELDEWVDVLVISAYQQNYYPSSGTVIRALEEKFGLWVEVLADTCEFDLRIPFNCWVSKPLDGVPFGRLLCVEANWRVKGSQEQMIENLFVALSVLETKGIELKSIAMPLLGAGRQGFEPDSIIKQLLHHGRRYLNRSLFLQRILFIELDHERAMLLNESMNNVLGRIQVGLPRGELIENTRLDILNTINEIISLTGNSTSIFRDLEMVLQDKNAYSFQIGVLGRRVAEFVAGEVSQCDGSLVEMIHKLHVFGIASWVISYLHVLRIFGNEAAHEQNDGNRVPKQINEDDVAICLFCMQRVLNFYLEYKRLKDAHMRKNDTISR